MGELIQFPNPHDPNWHKRPRGWSPERLWRLMTCVGMGLSFLEVYGKIIGTAQALATPTLPLTARTYHGGRGLMPEFTPSSPNRRAPARVPLVCEHCGTSFFLCRSRVRQGHGRGRFCSRVCALQAKQRVPYFDPARGCWVIPLTHGKEALIDAEDVGRIADHSWCAVKPRQGQTWYAQANVGRQRVKLHRFLLGEDAPPIIDHVNGDGLDCRRGNLRPATCHQNLANRGPQRNNTTGFKGVTPSETPGKWVAQIAAKGKYYQLGTHDSLIDAARAYDKAARRLHGAYARLNFPDIASDAESEG